MPQDSCSRYYQNKNKENSQKKKKQKMRKYRKIYHELRKITVRSPNKILFSCYNSRWK